MNCGNIQHTPSARPPDADISYWIRAAEDTRNSRRDINDDSINESSTIKETKMAQISSERHDLPRSYGWLRSNKGLGRRVIILWDTGASHTVISPRVADAMKLKINKDVSYSLEMADSHKQVCVGVVNGAQILTGDFKSRHYQMLVADIGEDDIIVGNDLLKPAKAGWGRGENPEMWQLHSTDTQGNVRLHDVPLVGSTASDSESAWSKQASWGVKRMRKFFSRHHQHMRYAWVRKVHAAGGTEQNEDGNVRAAGDVEQDEDAAQIIDRDNEHSQIDILKEEHSTQFSDQNRMKTAIARYRATRAKFEASVAKDRAEMKMKEEALKAQLLQDYPKLFHDPQVLPPLRWINHTVEIQEGATLPRARGLPRLSHAEIEETSRIIKDFLSRGWIQPSVSAHGAALFFVPKPNGGLRAVADYRQINSITKKILPALPLMENILTQIEGAKFFSALDCSHQFYQIRMEPGHEHLTCMKTVLGSYEYKVCPMGMQGSVATAMAVMESVLNHVISHPGESTPENPRRQPPLPEQADIPPDDAWKLHRYHSALGSYCVIFIDDALVYSKSEEEHVRHIRQICETLVQHRLYLNIDKCQFFEPEVCYLGQIIGRWGTRPTDDRAQAIQDWPELTNVGEVRSFLGLCGFVRRWIQDFAQIAAPLHALLKKGQSWSWGTAEQEAFDELKIRCSAPPVLAIPSRHDDLVVRCDASREAIGAVLYRRLASGHLQPVEYKSKAFAEAQKKLPAHDRECLALLYALKTFRQYLLHREFDVQTDNSALSQILTSHELSDLYARWHYKISQFPGMRIVHRPGRKMWCADALSRKTHPATDSDPFELEHGELAKCFIRKARIQLTKTQGKYSLRARHRSENKDIQIQACLKQLQEVAIESDFLTQARQNWSALYAADDEFKDIWNSDSGVDQKWGFFRHGNLLWKDGAMGTRLCVPAGADKIPILHQMHDAPSAAHPGIHRTLARVQANYYWKGCTGDVHNYVRSCHVCQTQKIDRQARQGQPQGIISPGRPWQQIQMDWIGGLPKSKNGCDTILVFICSLTSMVHLVPCRKSDTALDTANHFVKNVVRLHGVPDRIVSDRDVKLTSHFWKSLQQRLGCKVAMTTRHHPQANGKTERMNAVLADVLRSMCNWSGTDWCNHLDLAEFAINGSEVNTIGMTPFRANYAFEPTAPGNVGKPDLNVPAADEFAEAIFAAATHAKDALDRAKRKWESETPASRKLRTFAPGDKVLLSTSHLGIKTMAKKLTSKFVGPFEVMPAPNGRTGNPNVVYLKVPRALKIHMPINIENVKFYQCRTAEYGGPPEPPPLPIHVDGHDRWEVDEVVAERQRGQIREVLVKWTGFDILSSTWEPIENIPDKFIDAFRKIASVEEEDGFETDEDDE